VHELSLRREQDFVEVHCGAIPPSLLESQLFGHERGSFTGAVHRQMGLFEIADRGSIFLDEIGEMNLDMQVKLLRVLQERTFRRIGGKDNLHVDVRVITATNRDLQVEVEENRFRADLYYRLNVISVTVPPLRERLEDIPALVEFFTERLHKEKNLPKKKFRPETIEKMQQYRWIGNVREIENAVERLVLLAPNEEVLPDDLGEHLSDTSHSGESPYEVSMTLDEVKKVHIAMVLMSNEGNKMKTARMLGVNVKTLYNLIQRLGIDV
jgi:DNA-binding NtrC family response regulator